MFHSTDDPGEIAAALIGPSAAARELREELALAGAVGMRVLITGEYGVGKRRLARLIHQRSARADGPFVGVRCSDAAGLPARLWGNGRDITGAIERADAGTLFLQDVDALSPRMQEQLRQFLCSGEFQTVGSAESRSTDIRLVCSTTAGNIAKGGSNGFLPDLYYLLNTICIPIPPLRERREDVEPLLEFFTAYYARRNGVGVPDLTGESRASCRTHEWPANLCELQAAAAMFALPPSAARPTDILSSAAWLVASQRRS
jgi:DNA-binding NtrC family response regulator